MMEQRTTRIKKKDSFKEVLRCSQQSEGMVKDTGLAVVQVSAQHCIRSSGYRHNGDNREGSRRSRARADSVVPLKKSTTWNQGKKPGSVAPAQ